MKITVKKLPKSEVEMEGELEADILESYFEEALERLGTNLEIDGFRKGKAPKNVLLSKIPEIRILEEMADLALSEHYPKILDTEKVDAIGRPEISITKLARKNPLGFKIKTAVLPDITLPDYKGIAKKIISTTTEEEKNTDVSEEDLEKTIMDIRKSRAQRVNMADAHKHHEHEGHEHTENEAEEEKKEELPELNDEFVRTLGPFENVEDFKKKLKENIRLEKGNLLKEKTRLKIMEKILEEAKVDLPEILIQSELDRILYRMESDIAAMGLKFEDYLKHLNKKAEDLRNDFRTDAEKKAKLTLILNEIAKVEKISADEEKVLQEVERLLQEYKDADPERARVHVESVLTNERVFQFLESE